MTAQGSLRIVFAGTPEFALPTLDALLAAGHPIAAVYTQPDRPAGRGRQLRPSPVKARALAAGLSVRQPRTLREPAVQAELAALAPALVVVVAYGLLLPETVLRLPPLGCVNVHASLLPRWRGAAPIQRALLAGDTETGVSIMRMNAGLDTGPVLGQAVCPITARLTGGELHDRLAVLGAQTLLPLLPRLAAGELTPQIQDEAQATYAPKIAKAEADLDWSRPAVELERAVRAFNPWPVAQTWTSLGTLRIWRAQAVAGNTDAPAGRVIRESREGLLIATGAGALNLMEIQLPGKRSMPAADFVNAYSLAGQVLG